MRKREVSESINSYRVTETSGLTNLSEEKKVRFCPGSNLDPALLIS